LAVTKPGKAPIPVLFKNDARLFGADRVGRPQLYTPPVVQPGSSVSHFDVSARPDLLMEPSNTENTPTEVDAPRDLTLELLRDIGW
jgi:hypothetical protein